MTFQPDDSYQRYVPNDLIIPDKWDESIEILTEYFRKIVDSLNTKDIGEYNTVETVNGQSWFTSGDANKQRNVYRKVIDFGALPNAASKTALHGITTTQNTVFTRIYGTATDPGVTTITSAIPLPYVDPSAVGNGILLSVNATQVTVTTAIDYTAYTNTYIVVEYIQN